MYDTVYFILEMVGTVAFAASGSVVAVKKNMDIFGVIILGLCTACGGGVIRDLVLGITPPTVFLNPVYAGVSILTSLVIFIIASRNWLGRYERVYDLLMLIMDSIGLGVFTVLGIQCATAISDSFNFFLLTFVGVVTGVGGGVMRDVLAGEPPYIFIKHFYACASLIGAAVCVLLIKPLGISLASLVGGGTVLVLRLLAARFRWKLPKVNNKKVLDKEQ